MRVGDVVSAVNRIEEKDFAGERLFVHAEFGEQGEVVDNERGVWPTVRWFRTGTVTDCNMRELMLFDPTPRAKPARVRSGVRRG